MRGEGRVSGWGGVVTGVARLVLLAGRRVRQSALHLGSGFSFIFITLQRVASAGAAKPRPELAFMYFFISFLVFL